MPTRKQLGKGALRFLFPSGLVLFAAIVVREWSVTQELFRPVLTLFGYGVFGGGMLHGWLYNRSRAVFTLWVLFLAGWGLPRLLPPGEAGGFLPQAVALLVPLNLLALSFRKERGIFTLHGLTTAGVLLAEAGALLLLHRAALPRVEAALTAPLFHPARFEWTWIGQPVFVVYVLVALALAMVYFVRRNPVDRGLFWALWAGFVGLNALGAGQGSFYYFAVGGLIVQLSVTQHAHRMAYRDELTDLPSRRALNELLPQLGREYAIALLDVDHFKKINDTHGHEVGDQVLRMVATRLAEVQGGGRAFRYGGEEFVVVFRRVSKDEAAPYLEALRVRIEQSSFELRRKPRPRKKPEKPPQRTRPGRMLSVTVSIGVAERDKKRATPEQVLEAADKALYRAKDAGRNQVKLAGH